MKINYKGKDLKLIYTFHSFKYMEELDLTILEKLDQRPFKIVGVTTLLLTGAMNYSTKNIFTDEEVTEVLALVSEDGKLMELLEYLMDKLQDSSFFKNLQGPETPEKPAKK